jgi:hypothetical protein
MIFSLSSFEKSLKLATSVELAFHLLTLFIGDAPVFRYSEFPNFELTSEESNYQSCCEEIKNVTNPLYQ